MLLTAVQANPHTLLLNSSDLCQWTLKKELCLDLAKYLDNGLCTD